MNLNAAGVVNFPVRVTAVTSTWFTFTALPGHPEGAGRTITFSFTQQNDQVTMTVSTSSNGSILTKAPIPYANFWVAKQVWSRYADNIQATYGYNGFVDGAPRGSPA
jgi:hypothetical protein